MVPTAKRSLLAVFSVVYLWGCFAIFANGQSLPGYQAPSKPKPADLPQDEKAARGQAPLRRQYNQLKAESSKIKRLPALDWRENYKQTSDKLLRIGVVRQLKVPLDATSDSALYHVPDGDAHVAAVVSEGALRMRLHFDGMSLPKGARVFVYSMSDPDEFYGPYEAHGASDDGTFWTPPLRGDGVVIEYFTPAGITLSSAPFKISEVSHVYKDIFSPNQAGSCNLEITPEWTTVAKSVAMLDFITGDGEALCTGTLLSDAQQDQRPYMLTANHCISTQNEAASVVLYFDYLTGDSPPPPTQTGSSLLVTGTASDFTLLLLGSVPTGNVFFSGWDANPVSASTSITGIHHPSGSHKRISFGATNSNCVSGLPGPCQNFTGVTWSQGVTEPGSSGSGIWTGIPNGDPTNVKLVGQLYGGESACGVHQSDSDYYGRFSVTYPSVAGFLNGSCVTSIGPTSQSFPASGGTGTITVNAPGGCNWMATANDAFVRIDGVSSGSGNGAVNFSVDPNPNGLSRPASIVIGNQIFTINEARKSDGACSATPIAIGQTINGTLSSTDCPLGDGSYLDSYTFIAEANQQVAISMNSSAFDTYLYLLNPSGSILAINDDANPPNTDSRIPATGYITLPTSGTYTILANSYDPGATGNYSLSLVEQPTQILTVASSPDPGATITYSPADRSGLTSGATQFNRVFYQNSTVVLNAPGVMGNNIFLRWQDENGVTVETSPVAIVGMNTDHTRTAVYGPRPTYLLTVTSSNPTSGVPITVSPNDNSSLGGGTTQFTRTYNQFTSVTLTAPINGGGNNYFQKWQQDSNPDFSPDRTVTVNMGINHTMTAVYVTVPLPSPTPTPTPPPGGSGQAVAYQIDPAHTGFQFDSTVPPLAQRWSRDLGNGVSYPLIAGGKVFVTTVQGLFALDGTTGATLWSTGDVGTYPLLAYDGGRVFVINWYGLLRAFDAGAGTLSWSRQLGGGGPSFTSAPTAMGGTVYVPGAYAFYAVAEQDGTIKWTMANAGGDSSSPAVSATAVYGSYSCNNIWALSPATGSVLWHHTSTCFGGGGKTAVLFGGRLYARDIAEANVVLDTGTGITVGEFSAFPAPAFNGSTGYFLNGATLEARDISSGALKWSFAVDGTLSSAPIVVNGYVYVGSTSGKLYAINESTGTNVWTGTVGAPVNRPDEGGVSRPLTGLGAGEGLIVVPASNLLVAYQSSPRLFTDSSNRVIAIDSVTFVSDPFSVAGLHNFSADQRTRMMIFTSNLGLSQPTGNLSVIANDIPLTVEAVGTLAGAADISFIIVKLDPLLTGNVQLKVIFQGATTNSGIVAIAP